GALLQPEIAEQSAELRLLFLAHAGHGLLELRLDLAHHALERRTHALDVGGGDLHVGALGVVDDPGGVRRGIQQDVRGRAHLADDPAQPVAVDLDGVADGLVVAGAGELDDAGGAGGGGQGEQCGDDGGARESGHVCTPWQRVKRSAYSNVRSIPAAMTLSSMSQQPSQGAGDRTASTSGTIIDARRRDRERHQPRVHIATSSSPWDSLMLTAPDIDPIALSIGPLAIRWYGLMYLVGFLG